MFAYKCDLCGKLFEGNDEGECCRITLGTRNIEAGYHDMGDVTFSKDLCPDCEDKMLRILTTDGLA